MEIHQLEQFKTITECRTMREAADRLYLSQPALSQNLKKLEAELGCTLFDRSHNQLVLTPYGEILLTHAHHILFDLDEVYDKIKRRKQEEAEIIRIGSFYLPLNLFAFPQIANAIPHLRFQVIIGKAKNIAKKLIDGKLDLAFLPSQFCPAYLANNPLFEESLLLSVIPSSPLSSREFITEDDLKNTSLLIPKDFPGLSLWYEETIEKAGVPSTLIERMPIKEYLEAMDRTEQAHFSTSLMTMFSGAGSVRPSIPLRGAETSRTISMAYDTENKQAALIHDYIIDNAEGLVSNHAFLPFLMYQDISSNLSMQLDS